MHPLIAIQLEAPLYDPRRHALDLKPGSPKGYARPPGTGPAGETCGTCANYVRVQGGSRAWPKCLVIQHRWTGGPGTDIRKKSPACEMWQPRKPK